MFLDFGLLSALLVLAHILRSQVRWLQTFYVPSSIIAGCLGLIGGPQFLRWLPFSDELSSYPSYLVAILFATLFMGSRRAGSSPSPQAVVRRSADTFFYSVATESGQYGVTLVLWGLLLAPFFPAVPKGFAVLMPGGFSGGHGTATVIGEVLEANGWEGAMSVGYTFATIGLLAAVFGGVLLINLATRMNWTRLVSSPQRLPAGIRRGLLPEDLQLSMGKETVSPIALDPLAWHVALVLTAFVLALGVKSAAEGIAQSLFPGKYSLPLFAIAVLTGALVQKSLNAIRIGQYVDRRVVTRVGSTVSDYLIACGIASIKVYVVADYWLPLLLLSLLGVGYSVGMLWLVGRKIYHNFWFERSIFTYGWNTGVVANGFTLLRVVDPELRSRTFEEYGIAYAIIAPLNIALLVVVPLLIVSGQNMATGIGLGAVAIFAILLSRYTVGWNRSSADALRPGEAEAIAEQSRAEGAGSPESDTKSKPNPVDLKTLSDSSSL